MTLTADVRLRLVLDYVPPNQTVAAFFQIKDPDAAQHCAMSSQFLTLMNHFFLHYSTQPCADACPCRERLEKRPAVATPPPKPPPPPREGKEEMREPVEDCDEEKVPCVMEKEMVIDGFAIDKAKSDKFYFNMTRAHHREKFATLIPIFEEIMKRIPVILHGFHTCTAEQFARERTKLTPKAYSYQSSWPGRCSATALKFHHRSGRLLLTNTLSLPLVLIRHTDSNRMEDDDRGRGGGKSEMAERLHQQPDRTARNRGGTTSSETATTGSEEEASTCRTLHGCQQQAPAERLHSISLSTSCFSLSSNDMPNC
jgi:hypothetical protein